MKDIGSTQFFKVETEPETGVRVVLQAVYEALTEKGYNPVNQIVGYIMSGDPDYIVSESTLCSVSEYEIILKENPNLKDDKIAVFSNFEYEEIDVKEYTYEESEHIVKLYRKIR